MECINGYGIKLYGVSGKLATMAPEVGGLLAMDIEKPSPTIKTSGEHVAAKASKKKLASLAGARTKPMQQPEGKISGERPAVKVLGVPKTSSDTGRPKVKGFEAPGKSSREQVAPKASRKKLVPYLEAL
jgi:hypothetical protein